MNYIELVNNFWRLDRQKKFNSNETRLYFLLLNLANESYWKIEWLEFSDGNTKVELNISPTTLRTARKRLKDASLIDFIVGGNGYRVKTRYKIITPNPTPKPEPLYNKTKTKNNTYNSKKNEQHSKREFIASGSDFD